MKTLFTLAVLALSPLCIAQKTVDLKDFKNVAAGSDTHVTLIKSNENKVVFIGDEEEMEVSNEGGNLTLGGEGTYTVYYKGTLEAIAAGSDSKVMSNDEIKGKDFSLAAGSDSEVELKINVTTLHTAASSDAQVTLTGKAKKHEAAISSDAKLDAEGLDTEDTDITVASDAEAVITAKGTVNAVANSDGELKIYGKPKKVNETKSGDGEITVVN
ncbi:MAG: DUF2807 domain-containing protein [Bacteroidota bacterium]